MRHVPLALVLVLSLPSCAHAVTEAQALEIASAHLDDMDVPHADRETSVSLSGDVYTVVFHLPEGMLGGDFTLKVSAVSGEVLEAILER